MWYPYGMKKYKLKDAKSTGFLLECLLFFAIIISIVPKGLLNCQLSTVNFNQTSIPYVSFLGGRIAARSITRGEDILGK